MDLDKTLLNDQKEMSQYTADILHKCRALDLKTAFATARPERVTSAFQQLFQPDFVIANNGGTITQSGDIIHNINIPQIMSDSLISTLIAMDGVTCMTVEAGDCLYTTYRGEPWDTANWNLVYNDLSQPLGVDTPKISVECVNHAALSECIADYPQLHLYFNSGEDWSQVMHIESTKMNAIHHLSGLLSISIDEVIAFGDDYNDIEMIETCGQGIAVENAIEAVKQVAKDICPFNNQDGVAKWLEAHVLMD